MQPELESLLHVLPSIVEGELDTVAPRHDGDKLTTHALSLKSLDGNHLRGARSKRRREGGRRKEREKKWQYYIKTNLTTMLQCTSPILYASQHYMHMYTNLREVILRYTTFVDVTNAVQGLNEHQVEL